MTQGSENASHKKKFSAFTSKLEAINVHYLAEKRCMISNIRQMSYVHFEQLFLDLFNIYYVNIFRQILFENNQMKHYYSSDNFTYIDKEICVLYFNYTQITPLYLNLVVLESKEETLEA